MKIMVIVIHLTPPDIIPFNTYKKIKMKKKLIKKNITEIILNDKNLEPTV